MSFTATCSCGSCAVCSATGIASERPGRRGPVRPERTHGALEAAMLAGIAAAPELDGLSADAEDDATPALADAWAAALHVLSFYVERYHGESYLDTATELASVDALARMVGYRPAPALSASTVVTFTVDDSAGAAPMVPIAAGTKVQSVPRAGEVPMVFETAAALEARPEWNERKALRLTAQAIDAETKELRLRETQIAARPGDPIALVADKPDLPFALATIDRLEPKLPPEEQHPHLLVKLDGPWKYEGPWPLDPSTGMQIVILSRRAALFGYNAAPFRLLPDALRARLVDEAIRARVIPEIPKSEWKAFPDWPGLRAFRVHVPTPTPPPTREIDLDAIYPEAYRGRHVLLTKNDVSRLYRIEKVSEVSRSEHGITAKVTRLELDRVLADVFSSDFGVRAIGVSIETERVTLAKEPIRDPVPARAPLDDRIRFAGTVDLPSGRLVVLREQEPLPQTGARPPPGPSEVAQIERVEHVEHAEPEDQETLVVFTKPLEKSYDPQKLVLLGNAVRATHGETKMLPAPTGATGNEVLPEILGSGDARRRYQAFALRQPGLTYLSAANASGYAPALEVRVDGIARPLADTLFGLPEDSRAYAIEGELEAPPRVRFAGRLPTGAENVSAVYRVGGGFAGNLEVDRLITPLVMPPGLRTVTNPVRASGGADAEDLESARRNAPVRVVTFERIVSLGDYEAFARAFAGITQALATWVWSGNRQRVCLTVAGPGGANVEKGEDLYERLRKAIEAASPPGRPFRLFGYVPHPFGARIALAIDPAFRAADVMRAAKDALLAEFAPATRTFGAPVARSHLLACVQRVPGVVGARVESFTDRNGDEVEGEVLGAAEATDGAGGELLHVVRECVEITEIQP